MTKPKVYFTDFRTDLQTNLMQKLQRLCKVAGMTKEIDFQGKFTAIKMHFGELGTVKPSLPHTASEILSAQSPDAVYQRENCCTVNSHSGENQF